MQRSSPASRCWHAPSAGRACLKCFTCCLQPPPHVSPTSPSPEKGQSFPRLAPNLYPSRCHSCFSLLAARARLPCICRAIATATLFPPVWSPATLCTLLWHHCHTCASLPDHPVWRDFCPSRQPFVPSAGASLLLSLLPSVMYPFEPPLLRQLMSPGKVLHSFPCAATLLFPSP